MNHITIGNKIIDLSRLIYLEEVMLENGPALALFLEGLPRKHQPLLLFGEERHAVLQTLVAQGNVLPTPLCVRTARQTRSTNTIRVAQLAGGGKGGVPYGPTPPQHPTGRACS